MNERTNKQTAYMLTAQQFAADVLFTSAVVYCVKRYAVFSVLCEGKQFLVQVLPCKLYAVLPGTLQHGNISPQQCAPVLLWALTDRCYGRMLLKSYLSLTDSTHIRKTQSQASYSV